MGAAKGKKRKIVENFFSSMVAGCIFLASPILKLERGWFHFDSTCSYCSTWNIGDLWAGCSTWNTLFCSLKEEGRCSTWNIGPCLPGKH